MPYQYEDDIEIIISADCNYEKLVYEGYYKEQFIFLLNQDEGIDNIIIEFPDRDTKGWNAVASKVPLRIFEKALAYAKKHLIEDS